MAESHTATRIIGSTGPSSLHNVNQVNNDQASTYTASGNSKQFNKTIFTGPVYFQEGDSKKNEESETDLNQKLRIWLLGNHINKQYDTSNQIRAMGTCYWILKNEKFESWRSKSTSSPKLLWIHGPPGFGKTVLCARIVDHISTQQEIVAHYFFLSDLGSHRDPMVIMQSWIYHMALRKKSVANIVNQARERGSALPNSIVDLFRQAIKMIPSCTLVVDGLNECISNSSLLSVAGFVKEVDEAVRDTDTRILVMSRNESGIRQALTQVRNLKILEYEVCKNDVLSDIKTFSKIIVEDKLQEEDKTIYIQDELVEKISEKSEGRFLWLKMQQYSLSKGLSAKELQSAIEEMPAAHSDLYSRSWSSVKELLPDDQSRAILLLRLATFSLRFLTVREISEAVLASGEYKVFPAHQLPDRWDEKYVKERIKDLCYSLLETQKQTQGSPIEEWTIQPVHSSVKEFYLGVILKQSSASVQLDSKSMLTAEHSFLAELCIKYMNCPYAWQNATSGTVTASNSFTDYAANFWNKHVEAGISQHDILIEKFFDENSLSWSMWRKWFDTTNDGWANAKSDRNPAIPLCYAIQLGFVKLSMAIIKKGEERVNYSSNSRTALGVACSKGYVDLARELLAHGAKVDIRDGHGRTAVYYAAMNGHLELVKLLINNGANVNLQDYNGVSPFLAASTNGHLNVMRQLIQKGADIHQLDRDGNDALFNASSNGHMNAARYLIAKGLRRQLSSSSTPPVIAALKSGSFHLARLLIEQERDLDIGNGVKRPTILHIAIAENKPNIVKLLIDRGADLALQDADGRTPLFVACFHGHIEIVKLLIYRSDVKLMSQNADGRTPLFVACLHGHIEIVRLFIEDKLIDDKLIRDRLIKDKPIEDKLIEDKVIEDKFRMISMPDKEGKTPLYAACANRHFEVAKSLIAHGAKIESSDAKGNTPLSEAAFGGSLEIVQILTNAIGKASDVTIEIRNRAILAASQGGYVFILLRLIDWIGDEIANLTYKWIIDPIAVECNVLDTALLVASGMGHTDVVALLLNCDANCNYSGPNGQTSLYGACCNGHIEVAKLLIEGGANINAIEEAAQTPLMAACTSGDLDLVDILLQNGAEIGNLNYDGLGAAHVAAQCGHLDVLQLLLSHDADIFRIKKKGLLPIHLASQSGHSEIVDFLIENGSGATVAKEDGKTPLWLASFHGQVDVINVLLKHGVDIDARDSMGQASLLIASSKGDVRMAKLLLDHSAKKGIEDNMGRTPLYCASANGHLDVVKLLLDNGADMTPNNEGQTPAYVASAIGHIDILRLLIESGADIYKPDKGGRTLFHASCLSGHIKTTKLLLEMGADIGLCDEEGRSPLYSASEKGHATIVDYLIQHGADPFKQSNNNGWSLITAACSKDHTKTVESLMEKHNIDAEQLDGNGKTPLVVACEAGYIHTARCLVERRVNVNGAAADGTTPLLAACLNGHAKVVQFLLENGSDMRIMNHRRMTPIKAAAKCKYTEISRMLRRYSE